MCQWVWGNFCCCYLVLYLWNIIWPGWHVGFPDTESELRGSGRLRPISNLFNCGVSLWKIDSLSWSRLLLQSCFLHGAATRDFLNRCDPVVVNYRAAVRVSRVAIMLQFYLACTALGSIFLLCMCCICAWNPVAWFQGIVSQAVASVTVPISTAI